jgi:hypothetical protein
MKKNLEILGFIALFIILVSAGMNYNSQKQQYFITTQSYKKANSLLKRGYIIQDVDIVSRNESSYTSSIHIYYTLIKY